MSRRQLAGTWIALTCLFIAPNGYARTTWYAVELIVYSLLQADANRESWPEQPGRPTLDESVELTARLGLDEEGSGDTPHAFTSLRAEDFTLGREMSRLRRSKLYRPVLHLGWRQPGLDRKEARAVHISGGAQAPPRGSSTVGTTNVEGTVKVWRGRYLHVAVDLLFGLELERQSLAPASAANPGLSSVPSDHYAYFRLREHRRMRSRELHFLDHPMFGVLVQITPVERAPPDAPLKSVLGDPGSTSGNNNLGSSAKSSAQPARGAAVGPGNRTKVNPSAIAPSPAGGTSTGTNGNAGLSSSAATPAQARRAPITRPPRSIPGSQTD